MSGIFTSNGELLSVSLQEDLLATEKYRFISYWHRTCFYKYAQAKCNWNRKPKIDTNRI